MTMVGKTLAEVSGCDREPNYFSINYKYEELEPSSYIIIEPEHYNGFVEFFVRESGKIVVREGSGGSAIGDYVKMDRTEFFRNMNKFFFNVHHYHFFEELDSFEIARKDNAIVGLKIHNASGLLEEELSSSKFYYRVKEMISFKRIYDKKNELEVENKKLQKNNKKLINIGWKIKKTLKKLDVLNLHSDLSKILKDKD